jgi:hypothetical protein
MALGKQDPVRSRKILQLINIVYCVEFLWQGTETEVNSAGEQLAGGKFPPTVYSDSRYTDEVCLIFFI